MERQEKRGYDLLTWLKQHGTPYYQIASFYVEEKEIPLLFAKILIELDRHSSQPFSHEQLVKAIYRHVHRKKKERMEAELKGLTKDVIVLSYIAKLPVETISRMVNVKRERVLNEKFAGLVTLGARSGKEHDSCSLSGRIMFEYMDGHLNFLEKHKVKEHLASCGSCREKERAFKQAIESFQRDVSTRQPSDQFFEELEQWIDWYMRKKQRARKRRLTLAGGLAAVLLLGVGLSMTPAGSERLHQWWSMFKGYAMYVTAEDSGVRFAITDVVADEMQTYLYYEVKNVKGNTTLFPEYGRQVMFESESGQLKPLIKRGDSMRIEPLTFDENVSTGIIILPPIPEKKGMIHVELQRLYPVQLKEENPVEQVGEWSVSVEVEREPVTVVDVNETSTLDGWELTLKSLTFAPTATIADFAVRDPEYRFGYEISYSLHELMINDKYRVRNQNSLSFHMNTEGEETQFKVAFQPMEPVDVTSVELIDPTVVENVEYYQEIPLDFNGQNYATVYYLGSPITFIRERKNGEWTFRMREDRSADRPYDALHFVLETGQGQEVFPYDFEQQFVYVDRDGSVVEKNGPHLLRIAGHRYLPYESTFSLSDTEANGTLLMKIYGHRQTKVIKGATRFELKEE
ncbi:zf-HC2 domain-containing protein [Halalkalibacterium halodurans]|uniref:zf-HC2 domain-containing protein n=1 Tax=Halalkalibacterium halodurans TaxID=86665 RepID=UPI002E1B0E18|nr:zf-HC2 domain-containing protein [Halalkalibacterium halodurans]MED4083399.1 zf-HC2 domain-containing protein [Halalkalibacterium halodurans]MED4105141.1 zf-HC2 domain-containing protein [Halalkalibacterium halodurans]MED4109459.1 zf-HC2 domain-containing protein [Halalkalibacterium halodurans]MED4124662.1 zf-HC2 domain-containing protein [Halalkalibacterium halodurans]